MVTWGTHVRASPPEWYGSSAYSFSLSTIPLIQKGYNSEIKGGGESHILWPAYPSSYSVLVCILLILAGSPGSPYPRQWLGESFDHTQWAVQVLNNKGTFTMNFFFYLGLPQIFGTQSYPFIHQQSGLLTRDTNTPLFLFAFLEFSDGFLMLEAWKKWSVCRFSS